MPNFELQVVIPVYNEQATLADLIGDWRRIFQDIPVRHRFIFVDDGSTDNSLSLLQSIQSQSEDIFICSQPNGGHGPAILTGYSLAIQSGSSWIFQIDSDHQLDPAAFASLWTNRLQYDLLMGERQEKYATIWRRLVSNLSFGLVRFFYGKGIKDVNSPYRLYKTSLLARALPKIPTLSFAPNVLLSSWFLRHKAAIFLAPVDTRKGIHPRLSRMNSYFLKGSLTALLQTLSFRFRS
jgi:glycosyltransferase involved in cell wall biosynthesis